MGMFDSFIDADGHDWQTKAFDCNLDEYRVGDTVPADGPMTLQVEVSGDPNPHELVDSYVTIREGVVSEINVPRDKSLLLLNYSGRVVTTGDRG